MKVLLDTQSFLWLATDAAKLTEQAKDIFLNEENNFFLSLVSVWEMAIKISLDKLKVNEPLEKFIPNQMKENIIQQLEINFRHVTKVRTLPFHHRDPFDRLLIAQSLIEGIPILSSDSVFDEYGVERLWK